MYEEALILELGIAQILFSVSTGYYYKIILIPNINKYFNNNIKE